MVILTYSPRKSVPHTAANDCSAQIKSADMVITPKRITEFPNAAHITIERGDAGPSC